MMSHFRNILMVAFATLFIMPSAEAGRIDITQALEEQPEIEREIGKLCRKICLGNRRKSYLGRAWMDIREGTYSTVIIHITLRNRDTRKILGKRFNVFSDHSTLKVKVRINNETCKVSKVRKSDIKFTGELYRATFWVTRQLDRIFNIFPSIKLPSLTCP